MGSRKNPTTKNYAPEPPQFGAVARVNRHGVQCCGLALMSFFVEQNSITPGKYGRPKLDSLLSL